MALSIGDTAPDFSLPANQGKILTLDDLLDRDYLVLYFYPKDDTPGCTTEAKDFTALEQDFKASGARVVGISKDTVAKHEKFITKHELTVDLLSDEEGKMIEEYGVWVEKNMYGRQYMGIQRATYLIDKSRKVIASWPKVKVKQHAADVLETIKAQG